MAISPRDNGLAHTFWGDFVYRFSPGNEVCPGIKLNLFGIESCRARIVGIFGSWFRPLPFLQGTVI
jgi:hypothetical protein